MVGEFVLEVALVFFSSGRGVGMGGRHLVPARIGVWLLALRCHAIGVVVCGRWN